MGLLQKSQVTHQWATIGDPLVDDQWIYQWIDQCIEQWIDQWIDHWTTTNSPRWHLTFVSLVAPTVPPLETLQELYFKGCRLLYNHSLQPHQLRSNWPDSSTATTWTILWRPVDGLVACKIQVIGQIWMQACWNSMADTSLEYSNVTTKGYTDGTQQTWLTKMHATCLQ